MSEVRITGSLLGIAAILHVFLVTEALAIEKEALYAEYSPLIHEKSQPYFGIYADFGRFENGIVPIGYNHALAPSDILSSEVEQLLVTALQVIENAAGVKFQYLGTIDAVPRDVSDSTVVVSWEPLNELGPGTGRPKFLNDALDPNTLGYTPFRDGYVFLNNQFGRNAANMSNMLHNLLHLLGLGHSHNPKSIMNNSYTAFKYLQQDDIEALQAIYGPPDRLVRANDMDKLDASKARSGLTVQSENLKLFLRKADATNSNDITEISEIGPNFGVRDALFLAISYSGALKVEKLDLYTTDPSGNEVLHHSDFFPSTNGTVFMFAGYGGAFTLQPGTWKFSLGVNNGLLAEIDFQALGEEIDFLQAPVAKIVTQTDGRGTFTLNLEIENYNEGQKVLWSLPSIYGSNPGSTTLSLQIKDDPVQVFASVTDRSLNPTSTLLKVGFSALASQYLVNPPEFNTPVYYPKSSLLHIPSVEISGVMFTMNFKLTELDGTVLKLIEFQPVNGVDYETASSILNASGGTLFIPKLTIHDQPASSVVNNLTFSIDILTRPISLSIP